MTGLNPRLPVKSQVNTWIRTHVQFFEHNEYLFVRYLWKASVVDMTIFWTPDSPRGIASNRGKNGEWTQR